MGIGISHIEEADYHVPILFEARLKGRQQIIINKIFSKEKLDIKDENYIKSNNFNVQFFKDEFMAKLTNTSMYKKRSSDTAPSTRHRN